MGITQSYHVMLTIINLNNQIGGNYTSHRRQSATARVLSRVSELEFGAPRHPTFDRAQLDELLGRSGEFQRIQFFGGFWQFSGGFSGFLATSGGFSATITSGVY